MNMRREMLRATSIFYPTTTSIRKKYVLSRFRTGNASILILDHLIVKSWNTHKLINCSQARL
jgi:ribosome recycling factor